MVSNVRLREQGLTVQRDRFKFLRASVEANEDVDMTVQGDGVVQNDGIAEDVIVTGTTIAQEVSSDANTILNIDIADLGALNSTNPIPFLAPIGGYITTLSLVIGASTAGTYNTDIFLSNGAGLRGENNIDAIDGAAITAGDTYTVDLTIESNPINEVLAVVGRGDLRWIEFLPVTGSLSGVPGTMQIEFSPTLGA